MRPSQKLVTLVKEAQGRATLIRDEFGPLFREGFPTHPIPFFGPLETARILTIGLNPSTTEFAPWRCWPLEISPQSLAHRLSFYFQLKYPRPHAWFAELQGALSIVNCSHLETAAHADISPWATVGPNTLGNGASRSRASYEALLKREVSGLSNLISISPDLKLIIILINEPQQSLAIQAVRKNFRGRIEAVGKYQLAEWMWINRHELTHLLRCPPADY
jgi:hypothetical protein